MRSKRPRNHPSGKGPDDELDFVDGELLQLAAQLGAQANQLATVYPPKESALEDCLSGSAPSRPRRRLRSWTTKRRLPWVSTCAALVLAMGLGSQLLLSTSGPIDDATRIRWQPSRPTQPSPALADNAQRKANSLPANSLPANSLPANSLRDGAAIISPVMFVSELSDPEFEAWLDLRRDGSDERIAF